MKTLLEDIKNQTFKHVYLIYGDEPYLVRQCSRKLTAALAVLQDEMNFSAHDGDELNAEHLIEEAETLPFLAERRVIYVSESPWFKSGGEEVAQYILRIPETTYLIFSNAYTAVDRRCKLFRQIKNCGYTAECRRRQNRELIRWIGSRLASEGRGIEYESAENLLRMCGNDMCLIEQEMEKLLSYTEGRQKINDTDIEAVCAHTVESRIFEMIDAIAEKNREHFLRLYSDLLLLKEAPMRILILMSRHFGILMQVKDLHGRGFTRGKIASAVGVPEFAVRKYITQSGSFSAKALTEALRRGVECEERIKTGAVTDRLAVELFIVESFAD